MSARVGGCWRRTRHGRLSDRSEGASDGGASASLRKCRSSCSGFSCPRSQPDRPPNTTASWPASEEKLARYHSALDERVLVATTDANGVILDANSAFCAASQYTREERVGSTHRILKSGVHDSAFFRDLWSTVKRGQVWRGEICNRAKDGTLFWSDSVIAPSRSANGDITGFESIRIDITEQHAAKRELENAMELMGEMSRIAKVGGWQLDPQGEAVT